MRGGTAGTGGPTALAEPLLAPSDHVPMAHRSPKRQLSSVLHMPKEALRGVPLTLVLRGEACESDGGGTAELSFGGGACIPTRPP